ncbi:MAG: DUF4112 domain-containing protein [Bdellovibrionota bacterium]
MVDPSSIKHLQQLARWLDGQYRIPGTSIRIGWDGLLGLIPVGGDVLTCLASLYIVVRAGRLGVSRKTLRKMLINVLIDTLVGMIPVLGDYVDVRWKCNEKNVALIMEDLDRSKKSSLGDSIE